MDRIFGSGTVDSKSVKCKQRDIKETVVRCNEPEAIQMMYYFDHCATTPPYDEVIEAISKVMKQHYGNPSSIHRLGVAAENLLANAREVISAALRVRPKEIVFTSGGTESNNLAIKGAAAAYRHRGKHLITSRIEHASVYECFRELEETGYEVTYLPVDESGCVSVQALQAAIRDDTIAVSVIT